MILTRLAACVRSFPFKCATLRPATMHIGKPLNFSTVKSFSLAKPEWPKLSLANKTFFSSANAVPSAVRLQSNSSINTSTTTVHLYSSSQPYTDAAIGNWLILSAGLVFGLVVLGGVTRLTESGLSMVDWSLLHYNAPRTVEEWLQYFELYKASPEYQLVNQGMNLEEFKRIYYMEYAHRMVARFLGAFYFFPMVYFLATRRKFISRKQTISLLSVAGLILGQGLLGWYMVKSGLSPEIITDDQVPRVSQYRLAAHLSLAFLIYVITLKQGLTFLPSAAKVFVGPVSLSAKELKVLKIGTLLTAKLVFITAFSGAFVAGLDAGLIYNTFPKMGLNWIPDDLLVLAPGWKNVFENPTCVQFNHRLLGMSTFCSIAMLWVYSRRLLQPKQIRMAFNLLMTVACLQVSLGISTLLYLVPVPLAASHQAGSLTLLTITVYLLSLLRRISPKSLQALSLSQVNRAQHI